MLLPAHEAAPRPSAASAASGKGHRELQALKTCENLVQQTMAEEISCVPEDAVNRSGARRWIRSMVLLVPDASAQQSVTVLDKCTFGDDETLDTLCCQTLVAANDAVVVEILNFGLCSTFSSARSSSEELEFQSRRLINTITLDVEVVANEKRR